MLGTIGEVERLAKRQRAAIKSRMNHIDSLISDLQNARESVESAEALYETNGTDMMDIDATTEDLSAMVSSLAQTSKQVERDLAAESKDLQTAITKCIKSVDKSFPPDWSKAVTPISFDTNTFEDIIIEHLLRRGRSDLAETLIKEAGKEVDPNVVAPFLPLKSVFDGFKERNLDPALSWIESNIDSLKASASSFPFQVVKMKFLQLSQTSVMEAISFSRQHFPKFASSNLQEIQKLMGSLAFLKRPGRSPYEGLHDEATWDNLVDAFVRESSALLGLSSEPPLAVCIKAGTLALPKLLKLSTVLVKSADWSLKAAPPLDVDLGDHLYHSAFVCPVSREVASADNPPMMMQCGHVLCEHSLRKLSRGSSRFKCPYCPAEVTIQGSLRLNL